VSCNARGLLCFRPEVVAIGLVVSDVARWIEKLAPRQLAETWDSVGLQVGDGDAPVQRVMTVLTVTQDVVRQARELEIDLIVAHHPLLFRPLTQVSPRTRTGSILTALIKEGIALYVAHTNLDAAPGGVNDGLARRLGLEDLQPLVPKARSRQYKLVTFVPVDHERTVMEAMAQAGAGLIGAYSHCSFGVKGYGTFKPLAGANPFVGEVGELERVEETRLEMLVDDERVSRVVQALLRAHPYEEVAYDLYPVEPVKKEAGIGRVGSLSRPLTTIEAISLVKKALGVKSVRVAGAMRERVQKIAVVGGSGGSFVQAAAQCGAELLVTGDVDYHDADEARFLGLMVIDAGHFGTERHVPNDLKSYLESQALEHREALSVFMAEESDAFWADGDE